MATNTAKQKFEILYEDNEVLVINKPAGLIVHSDGRTAELTVVDWLLANRPEVKGVGDTSPVKDRGLGLKDSERSLDRSGIVHRLDRETSGALLIAKNQIAFARLKKQFQRQEIRKTYRAFVYGNVKNDDGLIDRPIARSRANPVLWSATRGRRGAEREAATEYRVLARFNPFADSRGAGRKDGYSFLELFPRTGRTHQIRVHLKAINYPIVCDRLYAPNEKCALGFSRLALHSRAISFAHPASGKQMTVEAPDPEDFEHALISLRVPQPQVVERHTATIRS